MDQLSTEERKPRGEVGTATPAKAVKSKWKKANSRVSLKQFTRELLKQEDATVKTWFANKRGAQNANRTEKNQARVNLEKQASKSSRKGK